MIVPLLLLLLSAAVTTELLFPLLLTVIKTISINGLQFVLTRLIRVWILITIEDIDYIKGK